MTPPRLDDKKIAESFVKKISRSPGPTTCTHMEEKCESEAMKNAAHMTDDESFNLLPVDEP